MVTLLIVSNVIVFIGDSVTDCGRLNQPPFGNGYVSNIVASGRLRGEIINVGISGDRLIDLENRWTEDVLVHKPTLVSVAIGVNDTWHQFKGGKESLLEDFENRYRRLLQATRDEGNPDLVLCEPFLLPVLQEMNNWREDLDLRISVVHKMAAEFGATLVSFDKHLNALAQEMPMADLAEDGIHPSKLGHTIMADLWLEKVGF